MSAIEFALRVRGLPVRPGMRLGIQRGKETTDVVALHGASPSWTFSATLHRKEDGSLDITGPWVHGRKGDRFFYLVWLDGDGDGIGRTKVLFRDIDPDLVWSAFERDATLCGDVQLNDAKGRPAMGSVRPPNVSWTLEGGR